MKNLFTREPSGPYVLFGKAGGVTLFKLLPISGPDNQTVDWELSSSLPGLENSTWPARSTNPIGLKVKAAEILAQWLRRVQAGPERPSDGPDAPAHEKCGESGPCPHAGKWGATGVMPPGHHWHWRNAEHTSGYLAHDPDPKVKVCIGCEAEQGQPHQPWCPVVTGTLGTLTERRPSHG